MNYSYVDRQRGPKCHLSSFAPVQLSPLPLQAHISCTVLLPSPHAHLAPFLDCMHPCANSHSLLQRLYLYHSPQGIINHIPSPEPLSQLSTFPVAGSVSSSGQDRHISGHHGVWMVERSFIALSQGPAGQCDWRLRALDPSAEHTSLAMGGINESA